MSGVNVVGMFDMRAPDWGTPRQDLYTAAFDMIEFADEVGVPRITAPTKDIFRRRSSWEGVSPRGRGTAASRGAPSSCRSTTL
jgi:hypothetical protein